MLSPSSRVLFAMTGMLVTAIVVLGALAWWITSRTLLAQLDGTLAQEAAAYSAAVQGAPADDSLTDATRGYLTGRTGSDASGLTPVLFVHFDSGRTISNSRLKLERVLSSDVSQTVKPTFADVSYQGQRYRMLVTPVFSDGEHAGVYVAALSATSARQTADRVAMTLGAAGLLALAIMLPLSYWATRAALSPLRRMAQDAQAISHSHPGRRIDYGGPRDELGSLSDSLNAMLSRLEQAFDNQRAFIADASHELRTPVAVIRGNVELLRSGRAQGPHADESLATIEHESIRMSRLLDELLSLARMEGGAQLDMHPVELSTLAQELSSRAKALGERRLVVRNGNGSMWVMGDREKLEQAILNIVKNAFTHTLPGGEIVLNVNVSGDQVVVSVTDDGPGIPEGDLERVFDRFHRAHGSTRDGDTGGAGLGLAIASRTIAGHGGTIVASNVEPHGARFTVTLPRTEPPPGFDD